MVWDVYVERISRPAEGHQLDEVRIAAALAVARTCLATPAKVKGAAPWLTGSELTLADLHAAPMIAYFVKAPEGSALLQTFSQLADWWTNISASPGFRATEPVN